MKPPCNFQQQHLRNVRKLDLSTSKEMLHADQQFIPFLTAWPTISNAELNGATPA